MSKKNIIIVLGVVLVVAGLIWWWMASNTSPADPGKQARVEALAKCLTDKGVKFYGAYWCPHCQAQKKLFGSAEKFLPYVECAQKSNPNEQTQVCKDAGIKSYPTWIMVDGKRLDGEQSFSDLAAASGCTAP